MSGHSKWATIKRKKEKTDNARGKIFTKAIKEITVAARMGGSNPDTNPRLSIAMDKARAANVPLDSLNKARLRGAGELPGVVYDEITYEGYGPGGVAIVVECATDNRVRTVSDVRHAFTKCGGNMGESGSVSFMFHKKGLIIIDAAGVDEDQLMEDALESGAEDVKREDDKFEVYTDFADYFAVSGIIEKKYKVENSELTMIADNEVKVPSDKVKSLMKLLDMLEDLDDVQDVYNNADIDEADLENL